MRCESPGTKNKYQKAHLYGVEINESAAQIASYIADVQVGDIEKRDLDFGNVKFDYIIFGDVLEHLRDPQAVVLYCRSLLKENGKIIACLPNLMHYSVMHSLLSGNFTYYEIMRLFQETAYTIENIKFIPNSNITEENKAFIRQLLSISNGVEEFMYSAFQYFVKVLK